MSAERVSNVAFAPAPSVAEDSAPNAPTPSGYLYVTGEGSLWRLPLATNIYELPGIRLDGKPAYTIASTATDWDDYHRRRRKPDGNQWHRLVSLHPTHLEQFYREPDENFDVEDAV